MAVTVQPDTPLAQALSEVVQPKLVEVGWSTGGGDDSALAEYVILMLVNGKTQEQIASELSNDLLGLGPDDTEAVDFAKWLFEQVEVLNRKLNGGGEEQPSAQETASAAENDDAMQISHEGQEQDQQMTEGDASLQALPEIPTGPRSQRNATHQQQNPRGRMMGHINKAMERTGDNLLHKVRGSPGSGRVNSHWDNNQRNQRNAPRNGRMLPGRQNMMGNNAAMNMNMMPGPNGPNMMPMNQQQQMQMLALLEEQARMMSQIMPGFVPPAINPNFNRNQGTQQRGRSLFERTEFANNNQRRNNARNARDQQREQQLSTSEMEIDTKPAGGPQGSSEMTDVKTSEAQEGVCKWNLMCRNPDCPYAHQSPAAPQGAPIDATDVCSFGAACKNRKCAGRHPSPAKRTTYQAEELCRFFPNCTNPNCRFKHPNVPMCRNGADCTTPGCKFTHLTIACKFNPCLNPACPFKHEEGQKSQSSDKAWAVGDGTKPHVSERRFVDENGEEELIKPANQTGADTTQTSTSQAGTAENKEAAA